MLEKGDEGGSWYPMDRWRKAAARRWVTPDKVVLVALLSAWWFFLQRDIRVLNLVDTVSYLTAVYSAWRVARGLFRWSRSAGIRIRRSEVTERGQDGDGVTEAGSDAPDRGSEGTVVGRQQRGGRQGVDVEQAERRTVGVDRRGFSFMGHRAQHYRQGR
jgi:hypothetical protein